MIFNLTKLQLHYLFLAPYGFWSKGGVVGEGEGREGGGGEGVGRLWAG